MDRIANATEDERETDVEITPEMIGAGVLRLYDYDPSFDNGTEIVSDIFRIMLSLSQKESGPSVACDRDLILLRHRIGVT